MHKQDDLTSSSTSQILDQIVLTNLDTTTYPSSSSGYLEGSTDLKNDLSLSGPLTEPVEHTTQEGVQKSEGKALVECLKLDYIKHLEQHQDEMALEDEMGDSTFSLQQSVQSAETETAVLIDNPKASTLVMNATNDGNINPSTSSGYVQNAFDHQDHTNSGYILGNEPLNETSAQSDDGNQHDFSLDDVAHDVLNVHDHPQPNMEEYSETLNSSTVSTKINGYVQEQLYGTESQLNLDQTDALSRSTGCIIGSENLLVHLPFLSLERSSVSTSEQCNATHPHTPQTLNLDREQVPANQNHGTSPIESSYSSYITIAEMELPPNSSQTLMNTASQDTAVDESVHLDFEDEKETVFSQVPATMRDESLGNQYELNDGYAHEIQASEASSRPLSWLIDTPESTVDSNIVQEYSSSIDLTLPDFTNRPNAAVVGEIKDFDNISVDYYFPKVSTSNIISLHHVQDGMNPTSLPEQTHLDEISSPLSVPIETSTSESFYVKIPDVQWDNRAANGTTWSQAARQVYSNQSEILFQEVFSSEPQSLQHTTETYSSDGYVQYDPHLIQ